MTTTNLKSTIDLHIKKKRQSKTNWNRVNKSQENRTKKKKSGGGGRPQKQILNT